MKTVLRVVVSCVVLPATYYFVYWLPCSLLHLHEQRWVASVVSLLCALGLSAFVWKKTGSAAESSLMSSVLYGAIVVGAIGFAAGFFGPILLTPDANQGPLLGIFFTGPAGVVIGAVGGFVWWQMRPRNAQPGS